MASAVTPELAATFVNDETDPRCPRCAGLMVPDRFIDLLDDTGHLEFVAARCVSCGEVVDPVILQNRLRTQRMREARPAEQPDLDARPLVAA